MLNKRKNSQFRQRVGFILVLTFTPYLFWMSSNRQAVKPFSNFAEAINCSCDSDPRLIRYIQTAPDLLLPPSSSKYNLEFPVTEDNSEAKVAMLIESIFDEKEDGTFLEAGAFDGEIHSTTLYFEKFRNWRGVLVEPSPSMHPALLSKNRKAWVLKGCLSIEPKPMESEFYEYEGMLGRIVNTSAYLDSRATYKCGHGQGLVRANTIPGKKAKKWLNKYNCTVMKEEKVTVKVKCLPLYSILLATGLTQLDFFSLDCEGSELRILKTIPFHKVHIKFIRIEIAVLTKEEIKETKIVLENAGYDRITKHDGVDLSHVDDELFFIRRGDFKT